MERIGTRGRKVEQEETKKKSRRTGSERRIEREGTGRIGRRKENSRKKIIKIGRLGTVRTEERQIEKEEEKKKKRKTRIKIGKIETIGTEER